MSSLAVFDFDCTIVNADSDSTIISLLGKKQPHTEWEASVCDWTPYMSDVFEHAYTVGMRPNDILDAIASMEPTPGIIELLTRLAEEKWKILLLTDANSIFVNHWLKTHGLEDKVTEVITNKAFWDKDRLFIQPCMDQTSCHRCPSNLCKSVALSQWCTKREPFARILYAGDGRNDFCPATVLPAHGIVFPRRGYTLDVLIKKSLTSHPPAIKAKVVSWDNCYVILNELFPNKI